MNKDTEKKKPRRPSRSSEMVEADIMQATKELVEELGFQNITVRGLIKQASIESHMFYKRYTDLDDLFAHFTSRYDYWLRDIADYDSKIEDPYESLRQLLEGLIPTLYDSRSMQRLLIWELSHDNPTTRRTAGQREDITKPLLEKANELLAGKQVDISAISAILTGGIYYLILHSGRSTFSGIDFSTNEGKERLLRVVDYLMSAVSRYGQQQDEALRIALRMQERGIDPQTIRECTGVKLENDR